MMSLKLPNLKRQCGAVLTMEAAILLLIGMISAIGFAIIIFSVFPGWLTSFTQLITNLLGGGTP